MGTNFYWIDGHNSEARTHIGKSSAGWVFVLHIYPEDGINDLNDWLRFWDSQEGWIEDEYENKIEVPEMVERIAKREREVSEDYWDKAPMGYSSWDHFHRDNHSLRGPGGLLRSRVESYGNNRQSFTNGCVKHGEGTWDCFVGEFS